MKISFWQRWVPHPFVTVIVFISWLMLAHSFAAASLVMAAILAIAIPKMVRQFIEYTHEIRWGLAIQLALVVLWDIIKSNFIVAKQVLGPMDQLQPKWFRVPLDTEHEQVNALLAMIITTTPGTVSAGLDQERSNILVHALNTQDTEAEIQTIKQRYEQPLMRIFDVQKGEAS
jgi:multicomponent K+:H+ antiporter subunit E